MRARHDQTKEGAGGNGSELVYEVCKVCKACERASNVGLGGQ